MALFWVVVERLQQQELGALEQQFVGEHFGVVGEQRRPCYGVGWGPRRCVESWEQ